MTRHDPPPAVPVPSAPATPANNEHPIDRLYRTLASNTLLAVVAALVMVALLISRFLPQLPADRGEADVAARWLAETAAAYGASGRLLSGVGLFDLWH
ncbi:MAG: hypothetical protein KDH86_10355, partial [Anaerolineae bacterium]|nr:hypothetical protein [Anaerolineae bacterium]